MTDPISRRQFVLTAAMLPAAVRPGPFDKLRAGPFDRLRAGPLHQTRELTAQQIVDRIRAGVGMPWRDKTVDSFRAGDPATVVTGIATTVMATLDTLRKAAAAGRNLVITQEPTFYTATDDAGNRGEDPIYVAKKGFIDQRRLVVWRFSDHWYARQPNEPQRALAAALGWASYRTADNERIYNVPETTLASLVAHVTSRLAIRGGVRIVGRRDMRVRRVFVSPGTTDVPSVLAALPGVDVVLAGEPREWEVVPYVLDTRQAGAEKALLAIGRVVSAEPGARACAEWIRTLVPEVPVESIPSADPYWSPLS